MEEPWSCAFLIGPDYISNRNSLLLEFNAKDRPEGIPEGDAMVVQKVDGRLVGAEGLRNLQEIMAILRATTEITLTVGINHTGL